MNAFMVFNSIAWLNSAVIWLPCWITAYIRSKQDFPVYKASILSSGCYIIFLLSILFSLSSSSNWAVGHQKCGIHGSSTEDHNMDDWLHSLGFRSCYLWMVSSEALFLALFKYLYNIKSLIRESRMVLMLPSSLLDVCMSNCSSVDPHSGI